MAKEAKKYTLTPAQVKARLAKLKSDRSTWEEHWQEIADLILPRKNTITTKRKEGDKRTAQVLDNTGIQANELLAGHLHGILTNPYAQWFELTTGKQELDLQDEVRAWLQLTTRDIHSILNNSNFQTEIHELYIDLPAFGTACMLIEEDVADIVRFSTKFIAECYIDENHLGYVDQLYRVWKWKASQIVAQWGIKNVTKKVADAYRMQDEQMFNIVHAVYPRYLVDPKANMNQYVSQYILVDEDFEIDCGEFKEFPYIVPRWSKAAGEKYGRGPGMVALPEMKVLNKMNETMLIGAQKVVDPPLQLPDDGFIMPIITKPGGLNYYRAGTADVIKPVFNDTRIDFGYQAMEDRRARVKAAYYVDQLQLPTRGPMMTATETVQRTEEQSRLLGPMLGRQHSELLRPLIKRVYGIMARRNLIRPAPDVIKNLDVRYSSMIAKAQQASEALAVQKALQLAAPFIQLDPKVAQNYDGDAIARISVKVFGAPHEMLKDTKVVQQEREAAQQQAQAQQQQQQQMAQEQHEAEQGNAMAETALKMRQVGGGQ
jgi:hypothetical protein